MTKNPNESNYYPEWVTIIPNNDPYGYQMTMNILEEKGKVDGQEIIIERRENV